ncbi:RNA polymerase sigma factor [Gemmatimonadetes bacterium T265]|nr:RNA polymerase sigma factor [Gemmatimonadetes bacterium T265]
MHGAAPALARVPSTAADDARAAWDPARDAFDARPPEVLARLAGAGDARAFTVLVERYHARCVRFARNMGLDREDAEEAVQDAFVRVHRALPRFREDSPFEPWLFRVLANRCRSTHARARWRRRAVPDGDARLAGCAASDDAAADLDAEALRDLVARTLAELSPEQREAFLLRHVEQLSYEEIARATGARLSTLRMRVKRACDAVHARLRREGVL